MTDKVLILLVEDEFLIAQMVEEALVEGGYAVHCESRGERAITELDGDKSFAALITDIRLAGETTGWDVAHHARRLKHDIAVVYMSGDSGHAYEAEGVPDSTFLHKPFAPDQLTTAVSTLLNDVSR